MLHLAGLKQTTVIEQSNAIRNIPAVDAGSHTAKSVTCGCPIKHIHETALPPTNTKYFKHYMKFAFIYNAFMEIAVKSIEFVNAANAEKIQITMLNAVTVSLSDSMVADVIFTELASTTAVACKFLKQNKSLVSSLEFLFGLQNIVKLKVFSSCGVSFVKFVKQITDLSRARYSAHFDTKLSSIVSSG
ncbi:hypothetical protein T06_4010 [Trichinella sp. T6]|nr:hypothetical protein T06_4010 [Trichinella sp. T6]